MEKDLYFIPVLSRALEKPDSSEALGEAFKEIERLGRLEPHRQGYVHFLEFMKEVQRKVPQASMEGLSRLLAEFKPTKGLKLVVKLEGKPIGSMPLSGEPTSLDGILPGNYSFELDTGRLLWEGPLSSQEILWFEAFSDEDLKLAAETEAAARKPTRQIELLDGEVTVKVFPGISAGRLEVRQVSKNE